MIGARRTALVTGGAGFIGSHLIQALAARGDRVVAVDTPAGWEQRRGLDVPENAAERLTLDLRTADIDALLSEWSPDAIFHLAGIASVPASVREPRLDFEHNAMVTVALLEAVRHTRPAAAVLFASSAAVYGDGDGTAFHEDDPLRPIAPYGVSKLAAERYMDVYAQLYGLRTASLRLFPVYGPGQFRHVIFDLICKVLSNPKELPIHGDGRQVREFVFVTDVADAMLLVADRAPLRGEVYNVGSGQPISIAELATLVCTCLHASPAFAYSGEVTAGVSRRWVADVGRLAALGFSARVPLDAGLARTVAWVQDVR